MPRSTPLVLALFLCAWTALPAPSQESIERTVNLSSGWVAYPGALYLNLPYRFSGVPGTGDVAAWPAFDVALGLPAHFAAGVRLAHRSAAGEEQPNEWEIFARHRMMEQAEGGPADLSVEAAFNGRAGSVDGELSAARWLGALRVLGALRAMSSPFGAADPRLALAGGAVFHVREGSLPLALAGDLASVLGPEAVGELAWSLAAQVGVSFTRYTLSLFATNTSSPTLQGRTNATGGTRYGLELSLPVPLGRFLGWYVPRDEAAEAVREDVASSWPLVRADIRRYLFVPTRLEVPAGTTVEWTNSDEVVHTVTADDGTWDSGAIPPGETWRARFDSPGSYPYHCGPHPFMMGVVIVR